MYTALHLEQQTSHAIKNRHFSIDAYVRDNNFKGNTWIL